MVMDPRFTEFSDSINGFKFDDDTLLPNFDQPESISNPLKYKDESVDLNFMDLPSLPLDQTFKIISEGDSPDDSDFSDDVSKFINSILMEENIEQKPSMFHDPLALQAKSPDDSDNSDDVLKYVNSILMEENIEQKPSMFHDPLALQATEKSLYDVIGEKYPASANLPPLYLNQYVETPEDYRFGSSTSTEQSSNSNTSGGNSTDSQLIFDPGEYKPYVQSFPFREPGLQATSQWSFGSTKRFSDDVNGPMNSSMSSHLFSSIFSNSQSILQFNRGVEEASKFLPGNNRVIIDLESYESPPESKEGEMETDGMDSPLNGSRGRKNHHRENATLEEERSSKQMATYAEDVELSEMFDQVLLFQNVKGESSWCNGNEVQYEANKTSQQNGKTRARRQGNTEEVVDLTTLLISCAQSVAADDRRTANEQLKRIRRHSSPYGDGSQRLAHIFADCLEARLAGTGSQIYQALVARKISATKKLKAYQVYLKACPFKKISTMFIVKMISGLVMKSTKKKLHIIDIGIQYGFQWPILIQHLSTLPDGPPELRITGIEFPQPGFRPAEFIKETGRRLAKYCERFNVPFQYHAVVAQKWETIKIEDLNLSSDELLVVNCFHRLEHLLDETVAVDSPRDAVLKLIRKMNPDIFTHAVVNGSYNAPFFVTRFREALFHYSSLFDMFDTNLDREDQERMTYEKEFSGREVMNVIACEGLQRIERPETCKQWQVRNLRAGFRMLPLDQELLKKLRGKVKAGYHKDFVIDEDGPWMLQGWKGRIFCASSCWIPA